MTMEPPYLGAPFAASSQTGLSLPTDARCLKCGYSLRGLREPRCPECGWSFDPEGYRETYSVRWPKVLVWTLVGMFTASVLTAPLMLDDVLHPRRSFFTWSSRGCAAQTSVYIFLGIPALIGLAHRREWGRKLCLVVLAVGGLIPAFGILVWPLLVSGQRMLWSVYFLDLCHLASGYLLPSAAIITFLVTGFRPRSLARGGEASGPPLPSGSKTISGDWQLLAILVLAAGVAGEILDRVDGAIGFANAGMPWWWLSSLSLQLEYFSDCLVLLVGSFVLLWLARNPARAQRAAATYAILLLGARAYAVATLGPPWHSLYPWRAIGVDVHMILRPAFVFFGLLSGLYLGVGRQERSRRRLVQTPE